MTIERLKADHEGDAYFDKNLYEVPKPESEKEKAKQKMKEDESNLIADREGAKIFDRVYSKLTPAEQDELRKIKDPTERREYINTKYSNLFRE